MTLKFRAWDKDEKIMIDWLVLSQTAFNRGSNHVSLIYDVIVNNVRFDKMMSLGQRDKTGKIIYEGDIMKVKVSTHHYGIHNKTKEFLMVVVWNETECGFQLQEPEGTYMGNYRIHNGNWNAHEIIGNIYEHSQLLRLDEHGTDPGATEWAEQVEALQSWKAQANKLLDPLIEYGQSHPENKPGASCTEFILDRAKAYDALFERTEKLREALEQVANHAADRIIVSEGNDTFAIDLHEIAANALENDKKETQ